MCVNNAPNVQKSYLTFILARNFSEMWILPITKRHYLYQYDGTNRRKCAAGRQMEDHCS